MSAACNAAEQAELEEGEIEDDGELLDEFPEIVITSPLHRHAHSRKRHQPSSANSTSTKENRSRHSKARKTSSTQQELLSQTLESHNNKVFDENVTAATSTGYDPCSPNLTNELPHKFTESRKANSSKLWNSIHSRVPKHGARKRQAIKDGVENRHDDSYSKLLAEYKNIQNQLAKLEEPVSTSHEESVLANNEEEEENHQAVEIPLIGLAETNLTSRAAITAGEDGELASMNVGKGESDVVLGQGDNARVNSARTQDNDDDEISELELRRIALASAAEKAVAQHVRKTQSKSPPSRHKMRPTPERDRQRRKEHYRRLESRTDPRKASAMGVTPVRRLARKQRERLKRQKAREELYHQEEARLSTRRASEHERHGKLQQRTSHLRILALEDNNEQINQFLQLMRASGRSGCPPSPPKHTRSGHVGLASQAGSTDRDIKPTASRDNYEEVAMEIDEDSNRDSPGDQGPIMTPWMACADASLSAQSLLHQLQVLARQPTAEGAPPSDYRRLTRDPAANDVDFRDMLIGHQRDDATAGELPPQPVAAVTAPDACQLTELIRDASASAHPENTLAPPRPATPDAAAATMTQTRSAEEGSCGSEAKPVVITDGEDEDDEAMRAMLLQSLAVKKRGKEEVVEVKLTRSQDRPAGMLKPQNQKQQMKRKLKAKMHKVPKHMPVVIQLGDSSSDSEDGDAVRTSVRVNHSAFLSSLDVFLKRARKSVMHAAPPARIEGAATPPTPQQQQQQAREKSRDAGASPRDLVHPTPDAVSQLPPERIKEYRRLRWQLIKKQMDRRKDGSDGKPSTAASTPQLKPKATKSSSSSSAAEVGLGDAARSLSGKPRAVEDADEEERKSREREAAGRRLQEHRDSMVRERQEAERMRLELIKKKSIVRIAEQKVKKLTQQLDVAEKIARRNKQLIVRLNTQAQEVQKRLDRGAQVENELLHTQSLNGGSGSSGGGGGVVRLLQKSGGSRNITERGRNGSPQMRVAKPALSNSSSPHLVEKSDSRPLTPVAVTTAAQLRTSTPTSGLTCHPSATVQHTTTTTSSSSSSSSYVGKSLPGSLSGGSSSSAPTAEKVRLLRLQKEYLQKIARLQQGMATAASPVAAATPSGLPSPTKVVQRSKVARRKSLLELNASTRPCLSENGESAGEGGKEATKKAAKETGKEAAKETGKEPERKAGKEACGATGEETTRKAGKEGREEARSFEGGSGVTEGATVTMPVGEALARVTQLLMESYERSPLEGAPSAADYSLQGALVPAAAESVDPGVSVDDVWCRRKPVESETMGRLQPYSSALLHFKSYSDVAVRTDRALGVLARGLETNRHSSELWMHYLRIYSKRADCSDIADLYKQATKYAPTYAIWWMWLQQEKNAKEKDAVCVSAISFLLSARVSCDAADPTTAGDDPSMTPEPAVTSDQTPGGAGGMDGSLLPAAGKESMAEGKEGDNPATAAAMEEENRARQRCRPAPAEGVRLSMEERSHCLLELLLYRVQLHLQIGKSLTAITILQGALQSKVRQSLLVRHLVLTDRVLLWLSYIHLLEMKSLPEQLFDPRNSNPGKIVSKKPFLLPWQPGMLTSSPQTLLALFKEAFRSCSIREDKAASFSMQRPLYRNLIQMEMARNRTKSARSICQRMLEACPCEPDMWLVLAGLAATPGDARRVHDDAIALNPHDARIYHAAARNCIAQGNREDATTYLRRCVCVYFSAGEASVEEMYRKLLGQSVSLHTSLVPRESSATDSKETIASQRLYLWLNYSLLLDVEGKEREVREAYESALSAAASTDAVQVTWMHYLSYVLKQATAAEARPLTLKSFARLCDLVHRCLMSVPTSFPLPFTPSRYWTNYGFHNQVVDLFIRGLPEHQVAAAYSKFMEMMPNNATLAVSAIYIAHKEGNWPEMHKRLWSGLHALPYAATLWKDNRRLPVKDAQFPLVTQFLSYLSYVLKQATAAEARPLTLKSFARLCDLVHRCLMSVPTSFPLPFTPSRYWTNYGFHNQVVDLFIRGLPEHQVAAAYSKFMEMMPNNATLAVRSVQRAMEERARTATHLCSAALGSNPACLKLVKVAIYIAHKEGNWHEMHKRLWSGLHALPYAATLWKDLLLLEAARGGGAGGAAGALRRCEARGVDVSTFCRSVGIERTARFRTATVALHDLVGLSFFGLDWVRMALRVTVAFRVFWVGTREKADAVLFRR
ncbi:PREDICTED: zinc finger C3H1 domain-containing protein-like [Priapulus caudatus]|uniref:Zinc finger C3H1 domain-containing protein-like n=1 Tax=Priapulus caudatus TaxID=37621 RepID=A0ABM1DY43_PRICU|nr:PREDICTED: zinc finger C3H1 domain-containing protein-like [Priapulus caudatus]